MIIFGNIGYLDSILFLLFGQHFVLDQGDDILRAKNSTESRDLGIWDLRR